MHNLVCCKKNLHKWKLSDSDKCVFCNCTDDYDHFSVKCKYNKTFWTRFSSYIQEFTKDYNFYISPFNIVLHLCSWRCPLSFWHGARQIQALDKRGYSNQKERGTTMNTDDGQCFLPHILMRF